MKLRQKQIGRFVFIVCMGTLLNLLGRYASDTLRLPLWLDTVGTCLAAYYTNIYGAVAAAVLVNVLVGFNNPSVFPYIAVGILIAVFLRFFIKKGYMEELTPAMMFSFCIGLVAVAASIPLDLLLRQGYTGNVWGDALYEMMRFQGFPSFVCTLADESVINIIDKQFCVFLAFLLIRFLRKRERKAVFYLLAPLLLAGMPGTALTVSAGEEEPYIKFQDYVKTIYNNANGLPSSEANAIAETEDGYIWIGGYAGLSRFDGTRFEYITEGGLSNVTAMITDESGRLWIGTNDRGIAVYDNGRFSFITKEDGLPANSIRTLLADGNGQVYAGTTEELVRIDKDFNITVYQEGLNCVTCLTVSEDGMVAGVDNTGMLFIMKQGKVLYRQSGDREAVVYYTVYAAGDCFYVGTTDGVLLQMKYKNRNLEVVRVISSKSISNITQIRRDNNGVIWLCGDSGLGYLNDEDQVVILNYTGFNSSLEGMIQDYEGNYWFASSRFGVMRLCKNAFSNIYENAGLSGVVVNAAAEYQGKLYCGTDQGLDVIDPVTYETVENELTKRIGDTRVRCLKKDSKNRFWICCYGGEGLLCLEPDGTVRVYSEKENHTAGDRFRCLLELEDGTMAAGSSEGLTFIKNGEVTGTLTKRDGLPTTQILCLTQGEDGTVYAGSDGAGIYVIRDGVLEEVLTEEQGLSSLIILRMTPWKDGWFVVTSNSLSYMHDGMVQRIEQFPYFNNYDILIHDSQAWILSSRGIFVADVENLLNEEEIKYRLYDTNNGLLNSITANAWVYIDEEDFLYIPTNRGVEKIHLSAENSFTGSYKIQIGSFTADGAEVPFEDGVYRVGSEADRISIVPSVCNYMLNDLKVCAYVEGLDSNPSIVRQSTLDTLTYTNVPHGTYTLHIQIYDDNEEMILQDSAYTIVKQAQMWEKAYFRVYLLFVLIWTISFGSWVVYSLRQMMRRRKELEMMHAELEKQVKEQTAEIREQSRKMNAMQWGVIESMAVLIESRDGNTGRHVKNTRDYAKLLASEMRRRGMYPEVITEHFVQTFAEVAPLHDVGKIKISDVILNKPEQFTKAEFEIMKSHTVMGGEIIDDILGVDADPYLVQMAKDVAVYHHEQWNGQGYPYGKKEKEIPLAARIMAVADVFDALTSKRVYKEAMSVEEGISKIKSYAGSHFEPEIAHVFIELKEELRAYILQSQTV